MGSVSLHVHPTPSVLPDLVFRVIRIVHLALDLHSTNVLAALPIALFSQTADAWLRAADHSISIRLPHPVNLVTRVARAALVRGQTTVWRVRALARSSVGALACLQAAATPAASSLVSAYASPTS